MLLLGLKHRQQTQSDCLAVCASIVLDYLGIPCEYKRLLRILGTTSDGTPFSNLKRLASTLDLSVSYDKNRETLTIFEDHLSIGLPIIVAVQTWPLPYWQQLNSDHAVVVVGLDQEEIFLYDPYFAAAPQVVDLDSFLTAWSERDFEYAVIGLTAWQEEVTV
ncbi:MAG: cysteine peptidase family C39 domain-containing protein [Caldilineaceae bacterium]|jgi:ABC-type bacteriocin/lantibiotic exporter with double-glycine peptidase domain